MADSVSDKFFELAESNRQRTWVQPAVHRQFHGGDTVGDQVLGEGLFREALVRERKRADRSGTRFAVLAIELDDGSRHEEAWFSILDGLSGVKRNIDVVGWLQAGEVLGLLLADTDKAQSALEMMDRARAAIAARVCDSTLAAMSMRVYAHPCEPAVDTAVLPSVDVLLEVFVQQLGKPLRDGAKRAFDVVGAVMLLALFAPVLLAVFLAVKLTSRGPALYRQTRIGRRGEPFTMLKFRTMYRNAGHGLHQDYVTWFIKSSDREPRTGHEVFKLTNDPRITPAGRFLRRTSLDELPQFWNVLRGEMSLVGPRPPLPFEVEQYQPWHRRRLLEAKPGVTGLWQVVGRSRTTFDEMVRLDLRYAMTHTLWTDIKILAATPAAMLSGKGAC